MMQRGWVVILAGIAVAGTAAAVDSNERRGTEPAGHSAVLAPADPAARQAALARLGNGGLLLVVESTNDRVLAIDPTTGDLIDANFIGPDDANLGTPVNAILGPGGDRVLISNQLFDPAGDVVQSYDLATGEHLGIYAPSDGLNNDVANNIRGIELRENGHLLMTIGSSANANSVPQFGLDGLLIDQFIGVGAGGLSSPFDVLRLSQSNAPLAAGEYLVSSSTNGAVYRYDSNGQFIAQFATAGSFAQQISEAVNGNILVASFSGASAAIYEFTPDGTQVGAYDPPSLGGYRGVIELGNGNLLVTNGSGIHEIERSNTLVRTIIAGVSGRYIEFVQAGAPPPNSADLSLTLFDLPDPVAPGATLTLLAQAANFGPEAASDVVIEVQLPPELSLVTLRSRPASNPDTVTGVAWDCSEAGGNDVACALSGPLPAGALAPVLELVTTVDAGAAPGTITSTATISGAVEDPVPGNNSVSTATLIEIADDLIFADGFESDGAPVCGWDTALGTPGGSLNTIGLWGDELYLGASQAGSFGGVAGGVQRIDLASGTVSALATTELVDGFVGSFVPFDPGTGERLYLVGAFNGVRFGGVELPDSRGVVSWDGSVTATLPGSPFAEPLVFGQTGTVWDGRLVAAGAGGAVSPPQKPVLALWDGSDWQVWREEFAGTVAPVILAATTFQGDLYFGGRFDRITIDDGGGPVVTESRNVMGYDGTTFFPLGAGLERGTSPVSQVLALQAFDDGNGEALYIGGRFDRAVGGDAMFAVAKWDGSVLSAVGAGFPMPNEVRGLTVHDDGSGPALYASGTFPTDTDGTPMRRLAKLEGSTWVEVAGGIGANPGRMASLPDGGLAVGGSFAEVGLPGTVPGSGPVNGLAVLECPASDR